MLNSEKFVKFSKSSQFCFAKGSVANLDSLDLQALVDQLDRPGLVDNGGNLDNEEKVVPLEPQAKEVCLKLQSTSMVLQKTMCFWFT